MFIALAGTDTQYLIDMLEEMFVEAVVAQTTGDPDPATKTILYPKSLPIAPDFRLDPELFPENIILTKKSTKSGKMVDNFYYHCHVCKEHSSQNRPSMCTHTHKCLNVKLGCPLCPITYDATDSLHNHIVNVHGGTLDPMGQCEAEAAVASLASTSKME